MDGSPLVPTIHGDSFRDPNIPPPSTALYSAANSPGGLQFVDLGGDDDGLPPGLEEALRESGMSLAPEKPTGTDQDLCEELGILLGPGSDLGLSIAGSTYCEHSLWDGRETYPIPDQGPFILITPVPDQGNNPRTPDGGYNEIYPVHGHPWDHTGNWDPDELEGLFGPGIRIDAAEAGETSDVPDGKPGAGSGESDEKGGSVSCAGASDAGKNDRHADGGRALTRAR